MTSWVAGATDLASVFQRLSGAGSSGYQGDWVGMSANLGGAAGKGVVAAFKTNATLKSTLDKVGKDFLPTPTAILDAMSMAVTIVDLLNGFGPPDQGAAFGSGRDKLDGVRVQLEAATPDSRDWDGVAARNYAAVNAQLQALVKHLQDLDKKTQALVAEQGAAVKEAHNVCAWTGFGLTLATGVALALYLIPVYGSAISLTFQIGIALAAAGTVLAFESILISDSISRMGQANGLAAQYVAVGKQAEPMGGFGTIERRAVDETRVDSFQPGGAGSSGSATGRIPTVAELADRKTWEERRVALGGTTRDALADGVKQEPKPEPRLEPKPEPKPEPRPTPGPFVPLTPAPASLSQMTTGVAKMSRALGQVLNAGGQVMGQVQQIVSTAQQNQPGEPPEPAPQSEAAPGAETGERAPVDVASTGHDEATKPGAARSGT